MYQERPYWARKQVSIQNVFSDHNEIKIETNTGCLENPKISIIKGIACLDCWPEKFRLTLKTFFFSAEPVEPHRN